LSSLADSIESHYSPRGLEARLLAALVAVCPVLRAPGADVPAGDLAALALALLPARPVAQDALVLPLDLRGRRAAGTLQVEATPPAQDGELAAARGETARYRQLVVDLENNAPPPFFGTGAPDDLKLIVGVGPVLERMLQQLGVTTYRQIARWSERDIDDIDAKLPEFPGRIRRDAWVTQARELHQSKYGAPPSPRERG